MHSFQLDWCPHITVVVVIVYIVSGFAIYCMCIWFGWHFSGMGEKRTCKVTLTCKPNMHETAYVMPIFSTRVRSIWDDNRFDDNCNVSCRRRWRRPLRCGQGNCVCVCVWLCVCGQPSEWKHACVQSVHNGAVQFIALLLTATGNMFRVVLFDFIPYRYGIDRAHNGRTQSIDYSE